ncbi:MAG: flavodoxin [Merdibacter sp.]
MRAAVHRVSAVREQAAASCAQHAVIKAWWYTMAPAVRSFLAQHDFAGKTVVPFMINGGSRMETKQSEVDRWIDAVKALAA